MYTYGKGDNSLLYLNLIADIKKNVTNFSLNLSAISYIHPLPLLKKKNKKKNQNEVKKVNPGENYQETISNNR